MPSDSSVDRGLRTWASSRRDGLASGSWREVAVSRDDVLYTAGLASAIAEFHRRADYDFELSPLFIVQCWADLDWVKVVHPSSYSFSMSRRRRSRYLPPAAER